jgi:hypothetical protein
MVSGRNEAVHNVQVDGSSIELIFPSTSRGVGTYTSQEFTNPGAKGLRVFTTNAATGGSTATVKVQVRMPGTTAWTDLAGAATAALGAVTGSLLTIYPGLTGIADSAGITINQHLGATWRLVLTVGTATSVSSVAASYLL